LHRKLTGSKNKVKKQGQECPLYPAESDTVQLPPTGKSRLILADADSIGLSRAGPEFEALRSMTKVTSETQKLTAKADSHP
jgi:hypothetical protein